MAERCSHVQCGAPATARVAFDALACFVWIDPFEADGPRDVGARGAGAVCTRHADRLVPPRGWTVQDRRGREPRLWSDRPPPGHTPAPPRPARHAAATADPLDATVDAPLPFDAGAAEAPPVDGVSRPTTARHDAREEIEALLAGPTSPLLSRAFNPARGGHAG
ncbi:MAG: hypothetical protein ACHQIG_07260 [Acidimicrobiia bacterium]